MEIKELKAQIAQAKEELKRSLEQAEKLTGEELATAIEGVKEQRSQLMAGQEKLAAMETLAKPETEPEKRFTPAPSKGVTTKEVPANKADTRSAINAFVHSHGETRDGLKIVDNEVIVPKDIAYKPESEIETQYNLRQFVTVRPVNTKSGSYPIADHAHEVFHTVKELEANPEIGKPTFREVKYDVDTYRGALEISQEDLDDTAIDLSGFIAQRIEEIKIKTYNSKIADALKQFTPVAVGAKDDILDAIKKVRNVDLDPAYSPIAVATSSFIQAVDTLKDKQGRYILQESVQTPSTKMLVGMPLLRVPDETFGDAGTQAVWIGDKRAVVLFDRQSESLRWVDYPNYGQYLQGAIRFDVQVADPKGGFLLTVGGTSPKA